MEKNNILNIITKFINKFYKYYYKIEKKLQKIKINNYALFKNKILKYLVLIILFVLFFDKLCIFIILSVIYLYNWFNNINKNNEKSKIIENFNNNLQYTIFEPSSNTVHSLSSVFKNPEFNLQSYNNVKIDPGESLLQKNKFLPECCFYNSEYSTSKGCACITPQQQEYLRSRGSNKSKISFIQESNDYKNLYFSPAMALKGNNLPFQKQEEKYIIDYKPLTSEKINEFNKLTNLSSYGIKK